MCYKPGQFICSLQEINENHFKSPIVSAIISIAQGLNLNLIAEGVETEFQSRYLKNSGCQIMQGFFYSKPLPDQQFIDLLKGAPGLLRAEVSC